MTPEQELEYDREINGYPPRTGVATKEQQEAMQASNEFLKARTKYLNVQSTKMELDSFLDVLSELRFALNVPKVDEEDHGMGKEFQKLKSAFSDINQGRIESRYLYLTDTLIKKLSPDYDTKTLDDKYGIPNEQA